jgi:hypothetical protein
MAKTHAHDDTFEIELTRSTSTLEAALDGLDPKRHRKVLRAVEAAVGEAVDQTLDWANAHFDEYENDLEVAASGILVAMVKAQDEPGAIGRVLSAFLIVGLSPDVEPAVKARRAEHGAKVASALSAHLARVTTMFGPKAPGRSARKPAKASKPASAKK